MVNDQCTSVDEQARIRSVTASLLAFEAGVAEAGVWGAVDVPQPMNGYGIKVPVFSPPTLRPQEAPPQDALIGEQHGDIRTSGYTRQEYDLLPG